MRSVRHTAGPATITLCDVEPTPDLICEDVVAGLTAAPKKIPPKYFYDERGARLFERITTLEAYYPTRTELSILRRHGHEIAEYIGPRARIVEFGSGSGEKTRVLLEHLRAPAGYTPVDISRVQLVDFALSIAREFPTLEVAPVCADYTRDFPLPSIGADHQRCVAFFPGSTIGNFEQPEALRFLGRVRRIVGPDGGLLIGADLLKRPEVIEAAYNDPEGVTAEFNLNLLVRINRECAADFEPSAFRHRAFFDESAGRVEMRLVSQHDQVVRICAGVSHSGRVEVPFAVGDYITTEYSQKYDMAAFGTIAEEAGWRVEEVWTDPAGWFAVFLLG